MILEEAQWREHQTRHLARLNPFVDEHVARRGRGEAHPVWDFLFDYYGFRAALLKRWSPGFGLELRGDVDEFKSWKSVSSTKQGIELDAAKFPIHRVNGLRETLEILEQTASRAPYFGCFGVHEWAMVYRSEDVRHEVPLRLVDEEIAAFVESQNVRCSHFDAFRFFTPRARGLNVLNPAHDTRFVDEQPGCIHANMDVYKYATKFYPWTSSDTVVEAFEIARFAREVDMCAAPYDLRAWGFAPIPVETLAGQREYVEFQREITERARPVRARLIGEYRTLLEALV